MVSLTLLKSGIYSLRKISTCLLYLILNLIKTIIKWVPMRSLIYKKNFPFFLPSETKINEN